MLALGELSTLPAAQAGVLRAGALQALLPLVFKFDSTLSHEAQVGVTVCSMLGKQEVAKPGNS